VTDLIVDRGWGDDSIDQAPRQRGLSVDHFARQEHLHRAFSADVSRHPHSGRGAEDADVDTRQREGRRIGGDREVAHGDELAARRGGDAVSAEALPAGGENHDPHRRVVGNRAKFGRHRRNHG